MWYKPTDLLKLKKKMKMKKLLTVQDVCMMSTCVAWHNATLAGLPGNSDRADNAAWMEEEKPPDHLLYTDRHSVVCVWSNASPFKRSCSIVDRK